MKKQILMLSALAMFMASSCSKSKDEPTDEPASCQLIQASVSGQGETITNNYEYNNGKITNVKSTTVSGIGNPFVANHSYTYTATSISDAYSNYTLDAQGRITTESGSNYNVSYKKTYIYNNDGYLTEIKKDNTNEVTKYKWTNGNLTKIEEFNNNGEMVYSRVYEYSSDNKPSNFYSDVPDMPVVYDYIFKYMGKQTKNLVSKERYDAGNDVTIFTYGFDSNKNLTSMTDKNETSGSIGGAYEFKYNCK